MQTGKGVARLRFVRELLGRTGREDEGEDQPEAGFTLIELMVVLLIMGILLAIAIPTFLSVTGGAKKTAAQSNLTNAITAATAIYTNNNGSGFPATTTMTGDLHATQTNISFVTTVVTSGNNISVFVPTTTKDVVYLSALDGKNVCWFVAVNEGSATTPPSGDSYGFTKKPATCSAADYGTVKTATTGSQGWDTSFSATGQNT